MRLCSHNTLYLDFRSTCVRISFLLPKNLPLSKKKEPKSPKSWNPQPKLKKPSKRRGKMSSLARISTKARSRRRRRRTGRMKKGTKVSLTRSSVSSKKMPSPSKINQKKMAMTSWQNPDSTSFLTKKEKEREKIVVRNLAPALRLLLTTSKTCSTSPPSPCFQSTHKTRPCSSSTLTS